MSFHGYAVSTNQDELVSEPPPKRNPGSAYGSILVSLLNFEIFQTSILFETNKFHHRVPLVAGVPGQLPPLPPLNPALSTPSSKLVFFLVKKLKNFVMVCYIFYSMVRLL